MDEMKICINCDNEKEISEFNFRRDTRKYRNQCRDCIKLIIEEIKQKIKIKVRYEEKIIGKRQKTERECMILIVVNVMEKKLKIIKNKI